jgi:glycogen phosphorylase
MYNIDNTMNDQQWFEQFRQSEMYKILQKKPLAYFCIEYALSDDLPTYAGGLGVLAGDFIKELADQKIPAVAVGLYYQSKYGVINDPNVIHQNRTPQEQGLLPALGNDGKQLHVQVPIHDRYITVSVWQWKKNTIPVYLLDTNVSENSESDRLIGFKLYDSDKETRLKQEIILGVGGFRVLEKLDIQPSVYHMNEGHSVFLDLEIIRHEMHHHHIGFHDAITQAGHHLVFTNHTLVAAGNEIFSNDLVSYLLEKYASELEVPIGDLTALGEIQGSDSFSLSLFARRLAGKINAVSQLHAKGAAKAWHENQIEGITNGIHLSTWDGLTRDQKNDNHVFPNNDSLKQTQRKSKRELLHYIKDQYGLQWEEDELFVGWARRMVSYKRPIAILGDIDRLVHIVTNAEKPVRIIFSGIAHQADTAGHELIKKIEEIIKQYVPQNAVYLPHYGTQLARMITRGCDVWMNTPVVGSEACGTSGMKACLNGVLPLSTKDGWMDEVDLSDIGWFIDSDIIQKNLLDVLEKEVIPLYYSHEKTNWELRMQNARELILTKYSTTRMLQEYLEKIYLPILSESHLIT